MDWDSPPLRPQQSKEKVSTDSQDSIKKKHGFRSVVITALIIVIMLLITFIVRPAVIGYSVYKQVEDTNISVSDLGSTVNELQLQLASTKANLTLYTEVYSRVWDEVKTANTDLTSCLSEKETLSLDVQEAQRQCEEELSLFEQEQLDKQAEIDRQLTAKDQEVQRAKDDLLDLQEQFDSFVATTARSVCCKARVDNPSIDSYEVTGSRLICLEDGANKLNC